MNTHLLNHDGLIGDFLGTIPVMIELSKTQNLYVSIHPEAKKLFELIPKKYGIKDYLYEKPDKIDITLKLDTGSAFGIAQRHDYYMSQAHFAYLQLPVPKIPPKAELELRERALLEVDANVPFKIDVFDYIISPFSRSLPNEQKVKKEVWQELVDTYPNTHFCLLGNSKYDDPEFIKGDNVSPVFDEPFDTVAYLMKESKYGLISVVTGTSHLAYHLDVPNILITNQGVSGWGINPGATYITKYIPTITVNDIMN